MDFRNTIVKTLCFSATFELFDTLSLHGKTSSLCVYVSVLAIGLSAGIAALCIVICVVVLLVSCCDKNRRRRFEVLQLF